MVMRQIEIDRVEWYSYDRLTTLGRHSSGRSFPNTSPGDLVPIGPDGHSGVVGWGALAITNRWLGGIATVKPVPDLGLYPMDRVVGPWPQSSHFTTLLT